MGEFDGDEFDSDEFDDGEGAGPRVLFELVERLLQDPYQYTGQIFKRGLSPLGFSSSIAKKASGYAHLEKRLRVVGVSRSTLKARLQRRLARRHDYE